ncbi:uncharacterized protein LOC106051604 isoform X1 [Biomphalaria glabrata]|uniref:Uncharacterized protein LOC106051604 isoform X1 n=1 Tax=Biomphalaria glabrata TaxID=6526 RepID=A0A9W3AAP9_BIOGL|nr:uncharacterized protein LOC106051604 isoform X1 [Biomphalaria glabrata]
MGFIFKFILCFTVLTCASRVAAQCPVGWFGSKCQFMCHCESNAHCDSYGQCPTKCNAGWFGQGCQYEDLTTVDGALISTSAVSSSTSWLTDQDVTTCNEDPSLDSITVQWDKPYPFTWLRIQAKNLSAVDQFKFLFTTSGNKSHNCINQLQAIIDSVTVDYRCEINDTVTRLIITGPSLYSVCSLYISGGRNVALKQIAQQTGTYTFDNISYPASLAVDGDANPYFHNKTCSHTTDILQESVPPVSWTLTLDTPRVINRITIYNRADCCSDRLSNFILEILDTNNHTVWSYEGPVNASLVYELNTLQQKPVKTIRIIATRIEVNTKPPLVTLCEVFLFGDCEPGAWGLGCTSPCPTECRDFCQQESGKCFKCLGYVDPPRCTTACLPNTWGINCQSNCSSSCHNTSCDKVTGVCDKGCSGYSNPPACTAECASGKWGHNCSYECSSFCIRQTCERVTGLCQYTSETTATTATTVVSDPCNCPGLGPGIGIGIAIGVVSIVLVDIAIYFIFIKRRQPPATVNDPVEKTHGTQLQQYDSLKENTQYKPHYETVDPIDIDKTSVTQGSTSSPYENEVAPYERYSPKHNK